MTARLPRSSRGRPLSRRHLRLWKTTTHLSGLLFAIAVASFGICRSRVEGISGYQLSLGVLTPGLVQYPSITRYFLPISECRQRGYVLLELLNSGIPTPDLAFNTSNATARDLPPPTPYLGPAGADSQWNESGQPAALSPASAITPSVGYAMPLLLVNTRGYPPNAETIRPYEYILNNYTYAVDSHDYEAQQQVQYAYFSVPARGGDVADVWMLGVLPDLGVLGAAAVTYYVRASCPAVRRCPANCGGPSRGTCITPGVCQCVDLWGGPSCTARLSNLVADANTQLDMFPGAWKYYYFTINASVTSVLLEVSVSSGDIITCMKPAAAGFLPFGVPTMFDYPAFCDAFSYRNALDFQYIQWDNPQPGGAYISHLNSEGDVNQRGNISFALKMATGGSPICPRNCSYPNGVCQRTSNGSSIQSICICGDGFAGPTCESSVSMAPMDTTVSLILQPQESAFFRVDVNSGSNLGLEVVYEGGYLTLMVANDSIPDLESSMSMDLPVAAPGQPQEGVVPLPGVPDGSELHVGIHNSGRFVMQPAAIQLRFFHIQDPEVAAVHSPYMIAFFAVVAVCLLVVAAMAVRRMVLIQMGLPQPQGPLNRLLISMDPLNPPQGLKREVISSIPLVPFKFESCTADEENQCAVCLAEYEEDELLRQLPDCHHMFHVACVDRWFARHDTCPLCRASLRRLSVAPVPSLPALAPSQPSVAPAPSQSLPSPDLQQQTSHSSLAAPLSGTESDPSCSRLSTRAPGLVEQPPQPHVAAGALQECNPQHWRGEIPGLDRASQALTPGKNNVSDHVQGPTVAPIVVDQEGATLERGGSSVATQSLLGGKQNVDAVNTS